MDNRFSAPDDLTPSDGNSFPADGGLEQADLPAYDDPSDAELRLDSDGYQVRADADEPQEDAPDAEPDDGQHVFYTNAADIGRMPAKRRSTGRKVGRGFAIAGKIIVAVALALAILVGGLLGYLTVTEYNPAYAEVAEPGTVSATQKLATSDIKLLTFNTGYGGLGEDADFFMDGGSSVNPQSKSVVTDNMIGIEGILREADADFVMLQEVDDDSARSFGMNQWRQYEHDLEQYETRFALNYSCDYVPYPLTEPIGKVHSGIATYSKYDISVATRYSLPCPFSWPTRTANLKRCLLVTRIPLENDEEHELVLINFHLEAYDDGEGKTEQTEQLLKLMQEEYAKGNYVIAGGDFNQTFADTRDVYPIKSTTEWVPGSLGELPTGWSYAYDPVTPTCRLLNQPFHAGSSKTQYYVIDGYILSPNVRLNDVQTLDKGFVYSDHNPVLLSVSLLPFSDDDANGENTEDAENTENSENTDESASEPTASDEP